MYCFCFIRHGVIALICILKSVIYALYYKNEIYTVIIMKNIFDISDLDLPLNEDFFEEILKTTRSELNV